MQETVNWYEIPLNFNRVASSHQTVVVSIALFAAPKFFYEKFLWRGRITMWTFTAHIRPIKLSAGSG